METGLGVVTGRVGGYGELGGGVGGFGMGVRLAKSSVCLIGSKPEHVVYLHISVQYIKYSLVFYPKNTFFSFLAFFKFPGLVKNLTA